MTDCHVCSLPAEIRGEFEQDGEDWAILLCVSGHVIMLRTAELSDLTV